MGKICFLFVTQRSSNNTLYIMFQCIMYHIVFTYAEDLLPLITKTNSPIYVVNEERELKGLVPLSSIVVEMTGKDKNEINELIQNAIEL